MRALLSLQFFATIAVILPLTALAGPSTSGGGFAVVCRNSTGVIESAEILDLYEARTVHKFELMRSSGDELRDYVRAVSNGYRLQGYNPPISEQEMIENVEKFRKIIVWLPEDEKLPNLGDVGLSISVPVGCKIEPLAIFYDTQNIVVIDRVIWTAMDSLNRSALVLHEIYYWYFRQLEIDPDINSIEARLITASDFATDLVPVQSGIPANSKEGQHWGNCRPNESCSESTTYRVFSLGADSSKKEMTRVQFTFLAGRPLKSQTYVDLPRMVNSGDIFPLKSRQLAGWTAEVTPDRTRFDGTAVKLLIKRGQTVMAELLL